MPCRLSRNLLPSHASLDLFFSLLSRTVLARLPERLKMMKSAALLTLAGLGAAAKEPDPSVSVNDHGIIH